MKNALRAMVLLFALQAACASDAIDSSRYPLCAGDQSAGLTCGGACSSGQHCYTQTRCGISMSRDASCEHNVSGPADHRCHTSCASDSDCRSDETCERRTFFGCYDGNGGTNGFGICCSKADGCP